MHRVLAGLALALLSTTAIGEEGGVQAPEIPELTVTLAPADAPEAGVWVGQELVMTVRVASRYPYEALDLSLPEIADAEMRTMVKPNTRLLKSYAGAHTVLETVLSIYPNRSGRLVIPPVRVAGVVEPEPNQDLAFSDESPGVTLDVAGIPNEYAADWWMVGRRVAMSEKWSIPVEELRVGDVVRREITVMAVGVPDDRMPVLEHRRTRGISVADAGGERSTERTAEGVIGTVRHAWDLKIERGGFVYVSPIGVSYWDPSTRSETKAAVPGRRIEPLPANAKAIAERLMAQARVEHAGVRKVFLMAIALVLLPFIGLIGASFWVLIPSRAETTLWRACHKDATPLEVYVAVKDWSREVGIDDPAPLSLGVYAAITRAVFGDGAAPASPKRLATALLRHGRADRAKRVMRWLARRRDELLGPHRQLGGSARAVEPASASQRQ